MEETTCTVCDEKYNKKNRKKVQCFACGYENCQVCVKTYLVGLSQLEAKCMNCNVEWKINFLKANLPKAFIQSDYKQHQRNVIFDKERQHFPEIMNEIHLEKEQQRLTKLLYQIYEKQQKLTRVLKLKQVEIQTCLRKPQANVMCPSCCYICIDYGGYLNCNRCRQRVCKICFDEKSYDHKCQEQDLERGKTLQKELEEYQLELSQSREEQEQIYVQQDMLYFKRTNEEHIKKIYYVQCPGNGCNGLVDNETDKCGICETQICKKCNEIQDSKHKCKEENIESAKKIKNQCRQCPKCKANIYRLEGCNDMFCVVCKTSFNWVTGRVMQKTTNPHYYEYIRQNNVENDQQQIDNQERCQNELVDVTTLSRSLRVFFESSDPISKEIMDIHQRINHIYSVELINLNHETERQQSLRRNYCKNYLENRLMLQNLKEKLQINMKREEKKRSIQQVLEAYVEVCRIQINEIVQQQNQKDILSRLERIQNFREYIIEQIEQTKKDYDSKMNVKI